MRSKNRSNVLLVEILIAVLFFMLSATVLVRVFVTSRNLTVRSGVETTALAEAQNVADALYAADDVDAELAELGFRQSHGAWSKLYEEDQYILYVFGSTEQTSGGELWKGEVSAFYTLIDPSDAMGTNEQLFTLNCARYKEVQP